MVLGVSFLAVLVALLLAALVFWAYGVSPLRAYTEIGRWTLGTVGGLSDIVRRAIPLILCGVGLTLAFRAQFWNIGAEGQLLAGAVAASGVALFVRVPDGFRLPLMFLAGFGAGAVWAVVPALLRVKLQVNEVISTLMMNYIMAYIVEWLVHGPWKGPTMRGFAYTDMFPVSARLPMIAGTRIHWPTLVVGCSRRSWWPSSFPGRGWGTRSGLWGRTPMPPGTRGSALPASWRWRWSSPGLGGPGGGGGGGGGPLAAAEPGARLDGVRIHGDHRRLACPGKPHCRGLHRAPLWPHLRRGDLMKTTLGLPFQITGVFNGLILFSLISSDLLMYWRVRWAPKEKAWTGQAGS